MSVKKCNTCKHWGNNYGNDCAAIGLADDPEATPKDGAIIRAFVHDDSGLQVELRTGPEFSCWLHKQRKPDKKEVNDAEVSISDENNFTIGGETYRTRNGNGFSDCDVCEFSALDCMGMTRPSCSGEERDDNKDVYFYKVKYKVE